jgi:AbrB family looped-hinge helix DNA binding protein
MAKVTSKLQVTIPKRIADEYGIVPGDDVEFVAAGDSIRLVPPGVRATESLLSVEERVRLFDEDVARHRKHQKQLPIPSEPPRERDWRREDLYTRGKPR